MATMKDVCGRCNGVREVVCAFGRVGCPDCGATGVPHARCALCHRLRPVSELVNVEGSTVCPDLDVTACSSAHEAWIEKQRERRREFRDQRVLRFPTREADVKPCLMRPTPEVERE